MFDMLETYFTYPLKESGRLENSIKSSMFHGFTIPIQLRYFFKTETLKNND